MLAESRYRIPLLTQKKMQPRSTVRYMVYIAQCIQYNMFVSPEYFRIRHIQFNREATLCCCIL